MANKAASVNRKGVYPPIPGIEQEYYKMFMR